MAAGEGTEGSGSKLLGERTNDDHFRSPRRPPGRERIGQGREVRV